MGLWQLKPGCSHSIAKGLVEDMPNGGDLVPGQTIDMPDYRMESLQDKFDAVDVEPPIKEQRETQFKLHERGGGWYDVVNGNGTKINDRGLNRSAAMKLLEENQVPEVDEDEETAKENMRQKLLVMKRTDMKRFVKSENLDIIIKDFPDNEDLREEIATYLAIELKEEEN